MKHFDHDILVPFLVAFVLIGCETANRYQEPMKTSREFCVEFSLMNSTGERIDGTNRPDSIIPLCFLEKHQEVITGIEETATRMNVGADTLVQIPPSKGFGKDSLYYRDHFGNNVILVPENDTVSIWVKLISIDTLSF